MEGFSATDDWLRIPSLGTGIIDSGNSSEESDWKSSKGDGWR